MADNNNLKKKKPSLGSSRVPDNGFTAAHSEKEFKTESAVVPGVNFHQMMASSSESVKNPKLETQQSEEDVSTKPTHRRNRQCDQKVDQIAIADDDEDEFETPGAFAVPGMDARSEQQLLTSIVETEDATAATIATGTDLVVAHLAPDDQDIELLNEQLDKLQRQVNEKPIEEMIVDKDMPEAEIVEERTICGIRRVYVLGGIALLFVIVLAVVLTTSLSEPSKEPEMIVLRTTNAPSASPTVAPTETPKFVRPPSETCTAIAAGNATTSTGKASDRIVAYGFLLEIDVYMQAEDINGTSYYPSIDDLSGEILCNLQQDLAPVLAGCPLLDDPRSLQQVEFGRGERTTTILSVVFDFFNAKLGSCQENDDPSCMPAKCLVLFYVLGDENMFPEDINDVVQAHIEAISMPNIERMELLHTSQIGVPQPTPPPETSLSPTAIATFNSSMALLVPTTSPLSYDDSDTSPPTTLSKATASPGPTMSSKTLDPTIQPSPMPPKSPQPTLMLSNMPTVSIAPTTSLTNRPSSMPTKSPEPTMKLSNLPFTSIGPTNRPSSIPTETLAPSPSPTARPTATFEPTRTGTSLPTKSPEPSIAPLTDSPSYFPSPRPTRTPTSAPTQETTTVQPSRRPTPNPTSRPTLLPTRNPTRNPTDKPTLAPTLAPTDFPTEFPTEFPSEFPSEFPTELQCEDTIGLYFVDGEFEVTSGSERVFGDFGEDSCLDPRDVIVLSVGSPDDDCTPTCWGAVLADSYFCSCDDLNQWTIQLFEDLGPFGPLYYGYIKDGDGDSNDLNCQTTIVFANC